MDKYTARTNIFSVIVLALMLAGGAYGEMLIFGRFGSAPPVPKFWISVLVFMAISVVVLLVCVLSIPRKQNEKVTVIGKFFTIASLILAAAVVIQTVLIAMSSGYHAIPLSWW